MRGVIPNHIIQNALIIGGTAGSPGLVTIDASDANGNPLGQSNGFALAGSLAPSGRFGTPARRGERSWPIRIRCVRPN
jgi:hypothetical protein